MKASRTCLFACIPLTLLALTGCPTADDDDDDSTPDPDICEGIEPVDGTGILLQTVATGLSSPVHAAHSGDGTGRLFVVEQGGRIIELDSSYEKRTWLDIGSRISAGGERGLLSVAFHPSFSANGRFFVYYTATGGGATTVAEYAVAGDPLTAVADPDSERVLLTQSQPAGNHNGGQLAFGPDGYLYIGLGDGGGANDQYGNGQKEDTFLAKILRIDVDAGDPYSVPSDNPFIGEGNHRDETFAWGLRNPWRFSFDRLSGALWIADVGQNQWEEIHIGFSGANMGWPEMEGNNCFTPGCDPSDYEPAIFDYNHAVGISITGGFVYRGCRMPDLHGAYFYSDYNYFNSPIWTLTWDGSEASNGPATIPGVNGVVSSFGEDETGELYVCDHSGGRLHKIVPDL